MANKNINFDIIFCAALVCVSIIIGTHQMAKIEQEAKEKEKAQQLQKQRLDAIQKHRMAQIEKFKQEQAMCDSLIDITNAKIDSVYWIIDSLQCDWRERAMDSVKNNKHIIAQNQIQQNINKLNTTNKYNIEKAYKYALQEYPYIKNIENSEQVFYTFFHDSKVKKIFSKYKRNNRRIKRLQDQYDALPDVETLQKSIIAYFDSTTNAQVRHQYKQIDSLLNKKNQIITQKQR